MHSDELERLDALIQSHDLGKARDLIVQNATPCVSLLRGREIKRQSAGESRYGGRPDLGDVSLWPRIERGYYGFFMQLNLADVPELDGNPLPESGLLSFFYADDYPDGLLASCPVIYQPAPMQFQAVPKLAEDDYVRGELYYGSTPHRVEFQLGIALPDYGTELFWDITETAEGEKAADRYTALIGDALNVPSGKTCVGQLFGYHSELNCDIREFAVKRDKRKSKVDDWRLLWNIHSDFEVGICVGDAGIFYILIHHDDLQKANFSRTQTELEV